MKVVNILQHGKPTKCFVVSRYMITKFGSVELAVQHIVNKMNKRALKNKKISSQSST